MNELSALQRYVRQRPEIKAAVLFGSLAESRARDDSDLDIALALDHPMTADERLSYLTGLGELLGRPVDLVDLRRVDEPLLGQILQHGHWILHDTNLHGDLLYRHVTDMEDFMPLRRRILEVRRRAWINS